MSAPFVPYLPSYEAAVLNSSAGKDSTAMLSYVCELADAQGMPRSRLLVVYADLGRVVWPQTRALAEIQARELGLRFETVARPGGDLLERVLERNRVLRARADDDGKAPPWPSATARWCTSDHKTAQVTKLITRLVTEHDPVRLGRRVRILNCLGLRASESAARAKKRPFGPDPANWTRPPRPARPARAATATRPAVEARPARPGVQHGRREVDRWLPIFDWSTEQVWDRIYQARLPWHAAYDQGMGRLSCVFCVLASRADLIRAVQLQPELADEYALVEEITGYRFRDDISMRELIDLAQRNRLPTTSPAGTAMIVRTPDQLALTRAHWLRPTQLHLP